jgi:hypothetical protein
VFVSHNYGNISMVSVYSTIILFLVSIYLLIFGGTPFYLRHIFHWRFTLQMLIVLISCGFFLAAIPESPISHWSPTASSVSRSPFGDADTLTAVNSDS